MTTDTATPGVGKIEFAPDYQSRQTVVPVADLEFTKARIERLERSLRECVELLEAWRKAADDAKDLNFVIVAKRTDATLARIKGTP